jgi:AAA domain
LPEAALAVLRIGFLPDDPAGPACTFPECDGAGRIIGLNRRYGDGRKQCVVGSHRGLTIPNGWRDRDGPLLLPEGASDVFALTALGLAAVGRPSNTGGVEHLIELLRDVPPERSIVVIGEYDTKPDGKWPGRDGAVKVAAQLHERLNRPVQWVLPPAGAKDVRRWVQVQKLDVTCADEWQELGQRLLCDLQEITNKATAAPTPERPRPPIERFTAGQLIQLYPHLHPPVIDGLLRERETMNIIGVSKTMKSWLGYGLALSIATGQIWLGRFSTCCGPVLLIDNELHKPTLAARIKTVGEAMSLRPAEYADRLHVWPLRGNLRDIHELGAELETVAPGAFRFIILDAKYRMIPPLASENSNADETRFYNALDCYADRITAGIGNIHHSSKGQQGDKRVTDVGAGAGAQSRATDCHLILREHEEDNVVVLEAAVRSFAPVAPLALRWVFPLWQPAEDVDPTKLRGRFTVQEQRQQERDAEGMDKIRQRLRQGPATPRDLRECGLSRGRIDRLLGVMVEQDELEWTTTLLRGNESRQYRLRDVGDGRPPT